MYTPMRQLFLLAATCLLAGPALGTLEMICPPSLQDINSPMFTELTSGPRTIMFREDYQPGRNGPFRVTVVTGANQCILLDNVPYNEDNSLMKRNYTITVMIPDFECRRQQGCALVVENTKTGNRSSAPIYIRSTTGDKPFTCPDSSRTNWPYVPSPIYGASLSGLGTSASATVDAVVIGDSLAVRVNFMTPFSSDSGGAGDMRFLLATSNSDSSVFLTVPTPVGNSSFRAISDGLTAQNIYSLLDGRVTVEIVAQRGGNAISGRLIRTAVTAMNVPFKSSTSYSPEGWLNSDLYIGQYARSSFFVKPYGSCAITTRFFGISLQSSQDGVTAGGTAGLQLTENRVWFSIDMYNLTSPITAIELRGEATASVDLLVFWSSGAHVDGVVMVNDEMRRRILAGISSIWVATERNSGGEMAGMLQEGMTSFLESGLEVPPITTLTNVTGTGTAFIFVTASGDISVHITLNNLTSLLTSCHLHGPAFQGDTADVLFDMSDGITQQDSGSWLITAIWRNVTASHLLYLRVGVYYLNMHTLNIPSGELRGQVTVLGDWMCPAVGTLIDQCYWSRLQPQINVPNTIRPYGEASVIVNRVLTLQYSVSLWYLQPGSTYTVRLQGPQGNTVASTTVSTTPATYSSNIRMVEGVKEDVTVQELQWAHDGMLMLNITSDNDPTSNLAAPVPPLRRSQCPQQRYTTAVGGQLGWSPGVAYPVNIVKALSGDSINFNFTSPDDVYLFDNKNRYDGCVFNVGNTPTARLLATASNNISRTMFVYKFTEPGIYYFGSRSNCLADPPMKVAYNATAAVSTGELIPADYCSRSLYSVTNHRFLNLGDSLVLVGVLIGIVVGVIILGAAIALTFVLKSRQKGGYDVSEKGGGGEGVAKGDGY